MTYRPYPNVDRALRQLARHVQPEPAYQPSEFELRLAKQATSALDAAGRALAPLVQRLVEGLRQPTDPRSAFTPVS
ncbi:hypothetical protein [Streptomyces sp. NPDC048669]|uniref:hypothetical protein n=1 Tax=Streptomyces sp. NPDC048669 TaxID=3155267 RepID=UPI0034321D46